MLSSVPIRHPLRTGLSRVLLARALSPGFRIVSRPLSSTSSRIFQQPPHLPDVTYQASNYPEALGWPEEDLTATADEGAGFYPLRLGEALDHERFVITRKLGWGGYSTVWLARDRKENRHVAIKVLSAFASREIKEGRLAELELLRKVTNASPNHRGAGHVIRLLHEFTFESSAGQHVCLVTDVLSYSASGLQSQLQDPRLPLAFILRLTKHVLKGLEYLHDECKVVHSDLKPGNILLLPSDVNEVIIHELSAQVGKFYGFPKVIQPKEPPFHPVVSSPLIFHLDTSKDAGLDWVIVDMGHAHPQGEHLSKLVQPYALRAPEVILGLEWGTAIDIWSLGCMMYEFATSSWLFWPEAMGDISSDVVHLAQMTRRTGQDHDDVALKQYEIREKHHDLHGMLKRATMGDAELLPIESELNESTVYSDGAGEVASFVRIMRSFLALDPAKRPRAAEALRDPAFMDIP
ncbi:kinase-like domain-containing protein [Thelephora terrestris]|uniref:non-specific serine/threonine protein kinase n=1 Tax=Thelephora terrestris TaxID=56493 RepID=A0A9P6H784_9AGAM|nr:kinase-like domain-containing protein [Thelephora terrestris]